MFTRTCWHLCEIHPPYVDKYPTVGARSPRQIPDVLRYSYRFIEPRLLRDVVGILGNPTSTGVEPNVGATFVVALL